MKRSLYYKYNLELNYCLVPCHTVLIFIPKHSRRRHFDLRKFRIQQIANGVVLAHVSFGQAKRCRKTNIFKIRLDFECALDKIGQVLLRTCNFRECE